MFVLLSELLAKSCNLFVLAQSDNVCCPLQFHLEHLVKLFGDSEDHVLSVVFDEFVVILLVAVTNTVIVDMDGDDDDTIFGSFDAYAWIRFGPF